MLVPRGGHNPAATAAAATGLATTTTTPYNIPLTVWKIVFQVFLTLLNIVCWMIPLYSTSISTAMLSYMNAFSGGVFLTLAFCHLIPECAHDFAAGNGGDHPSIIPYAGVLFGYLLIFYVEKIAFGDAAHAIMIPAIPPVPPHHNAKTTMSLGKANGTAAAASSSSAVSSAATTKTTTTTIVAGGGSSNNNGNSNSSGNSNSGSNSAVILLAALSVHSVLEMMALGLARSFTDAAVLTGSIALHQPAESIALLVAFLKTGKSRRDILSFLSAFAVMGPLGVALGILVQEYAPSQFDTIVLAIVAGTFVYVGATEVIPEEFDHHDDQQHSTGNDIDGGGGGGGSISSIKYKKFGCLMLGVVAILVITQYTMG
jgi:solute carrier family 39 (zinc transporter), member 1/2/3